MPKLRLPLAIPPFLLLPPPPPWALSLTSVFELKPSRRTELAPDDQPLPARLAGVQLREGSVQAEQSGIHSIYPVYQRTTECAREHVAKAPREDRVDQLVVIFFVHGGS